MVTLNYDEDLHVQYVAIQPLTVPTITVGANPISGDSLLCGWSWIETTGAAPATFELYDGGDATGQLIAPFSLLAGQSRSDSMPFPGIYCTRGLFINVLTGSIRGTVWVRDV